MQLSSNPLDDELMPLAGSQSEPDFLFVKSWGERSSSNVPALVAIQTGSHDILTAVGPTIALSKKMFRSGLEVASLG